MPKLTIRMPDGKHARLKALARSNSVSLNKLMDELATVALTNYDARALRDRLCAWQTQARVDSSRQARPRRLNEKTANPPDNAGTFAGTPVFAHVEPASALAFPSLFDPHPPTTNSLIYREFLND
jgi:hypothetical protein